MYKDFHQVIRSASFQASSIHSHSRRRIGSILHVNNDHHSPTSPPLSPSPSSPSALPPVSATSTAGSTVGGGGENTKTSSTVSPELKKPWGREAKEIRMLSDLWLMSAATFRRLGKIEQAKGAIQEAEARDEDNPNVWIQVRGFSFSTFTLSLLISLFLFAVGIILSRLGTPSTCYRCVA